jgi:hypothetical protein
LGYLDGTDILHIRTILKFASSARYDGRPTHRWVKQLPPAKLHLFSRRLSVWRAKSEKATDEEATLITATHSRLPATAERRLKRLAEKSEQGLLKAPELEEYRELARQAEQLNAQRVAALAKLAHRWEKPIHVVRREIGRREGENGAASHSTRRSSTEPS